MNVLDVVIGLIVLFIVGGCIALGWAFIYICWSWAKDDRDYAKRYLRKGK